MIKDIFPALKPTLNLDFAGTKTLDPRIEFTRATAATYYDGKTFAKAEENLLTYSQQFDNAAWTRSSVSITADATTAPDGTSTADLIYPSSSGSWRMASRSPMTFAGAVTVSVYAKASGFSHLYIAFDNTTARGAWFNLTTGVKGTKGADISGSEIVDVGGGWYRCYVTFTTATANYAIIGLSDADASGVATASGTSGAHLWGAQLEQRSGVTAYTETTAQPITNYIPVLMTAPAGVARFYHNPATGESLGLLIEGSSTNLLTYSEQFDNVAWTATNCSVAANAIVAPDGSLTADKVKASTGTNQKSINRSGSQVTATIGTTYAYSVYLKAAEQTSVVLYFQNAASSGYVTFNLSAGTASAGGSITSVGNGWYRCSISGVATTTSVYPLMYFSLASITGDGYSGFYVWGAQIEARSDATSYIKTEASQVTRSADDAKMTGANFSSWYRQDAGTFFANVMGSSLGNRFVYSVDNGTSTSGNNYMHSAFESNKHFNVVSSGNTVAQLDAGTCTANASAKFACAYTVNDFAASLNGGSVASDPSGNLPIGLSRLLIGNAYDYAPQNNINGTIKRLAYYPARLTNAQLQALTA
jgi:hypothetical protein